MCGWQDVCDNAGGKVLISGSYRLGVNFKGGDIDSIVVVPRHLTHEDFFETFVPKLQKLEQTEDIIPIAGAHVPIIQLLFNGVDIDLLFCALNSATVPNRLNILDDSILAHLDPKSQRRYGLWPVFPRCFSVTGVTALQFKWPS